MAGLRIENQGRNQVTVVENWFIDRYMAEASGEFVKVYLCLLRYQNRGSLTVADLAEHLNHTEADILRAFRYWERVGLLRLSYGADGALEGVALTVEPEGESEQHSSERHSSEAAVTAADRIQEEDGWEAYEAQSVKLELSPAQAPKKLSDLQKDAVFSQLLFLAETYRKQPLSRKDTDIFVNLYGNLGMSGELLEYLIESCVEAGHPSMAYMEKVALNWHQAGIRTPEEAKERNTVYRKEYFSVLRALGISGRNPAKGELEFLNRWFGDWGLGLELVEEACNRTMRAIQKPSFPYTDKILQGWREKGIRTVGEIEKLDQKPERKAAGQSVGKTAKTTNRFHNFQEHDYDYDALMKQAVRQNIEKYREK